MPPHSIVKEKEAGATHYKVEFKEAAAPKAPKAKAASPEKPVKKGGD